MAFPEAGLYVNSAETVCPATLVPRVPWQRLHEIMMEEPQMQVSLLVRVAFDLRQAQAWRIVLMLWPARNIRRSGWPPSCWSAVAASGLL